MTRFTMFAFAIMMLASASAAVVEESANCNMACCRGTWTGTACVVSGNILKVRHELHADGQAFHRCYADDNHATNGCICQCADAAADFTDVNRFNTAAPAALPASGCYYTPADGCGATSLGGPSNCNCCTAGADSACSIDLTDSPHEPHTESECVALDHSYAWCP
jgi:hypothetical protein